jgi:hypothetical protein
MLSKKLKYEDENRGFETEWKNSLYLWREIKQNVLFLKPNIIKGVLRELHLISRPCCFTPGI